MQLELFNQVLEKANRLIDALNCGRKPKEMYFAYLMYQVRDQYLLSVINKDSDLVFNILDKNGDIPTDACFRIWPQVAEELNITISDLDKHEVVYIGEIAKQISHA